MTGSTGSITPKGGVDGWVLDSYEWYRNTGILRYSRARRGMPTEKVVIRRPEICIPDGNWGEEV